MILPTQEYAVQLRSNEGPFLAERCSSPDDGAMVAQRLFDMLIEKLR